MAWKGRFRHLSPGGGGREIEMMCVCVWMRDLLLLL